MELWKRRGTVGSLSQAQRREKELVDHVVDGIDEGRRTGALIEEIIADCRLRALAESEDASWRLLLGRFLMAAGRPTEALAELEAGARLDQHDPRIATHLGLWHEAAFRYAGDDYSNIELPSLVGPEITVDVSAFADIAGRVSPATRAANAQTFFAVALRFSLPARDMRFLKRHFEAVRMQPESVHSLPAAEPLAATLAS